MREPDSESVRAQVAKACPPTLPRWVGGGLTITLLGLRAERVHLRVELDLQHAVAERCRRILDIGAVRQGDRAIEAAVAALAAVEAVFTACLLLLALPLNRYRVLRDLDRRDPAPDWLPAWRHRPARSATW